MNATPALVRATLRPYQAHGAAWLGWIGDAGPGGLLADDMGLGKTLQVLEALSRQYQARGTLRALVITTTSTTDNWRAECEKFAPYLRVAVWAGPDRRPHAAQVFRQFHVVVTSYAIARIDRDLLARETFDWIILDEAQAIKNADAGTYKMVSALRGRRRLAMTGTPIENSPKDFHAILDWAVPGVLGTAEWFEGAYGGGLSSGDADAAARLHRLVGPFLLRRLKTEVAKDLPPKIETQRLVALPPVQRQVYDTIKDAAIRAVESLEGASDVTAKQRSAVFTMILRLRQVACDPRLVGIPYQGGGKLRALVGILLQARASGQKVLVFSSFKAMVDLLEKDLVRFGIGTCSITGETTDRPAVIKRFERDPQKTAFLITLKAGGAGLNLTAATIVVHFDPWWNPAAQDQATDRAYRIGQTRPVTVYSLLAENTIEDRMMATIGQKRDVAHLLLGEGGEDDAPLFAHTMHDLLALLRHPGKRPP